MTFYEDYKPFRNYIRQFDRLSGLIDIWVYLEHILDRRPLPQNYAAGRPSQPLREIIYPWELEVIARELIMHGGSGGSLSLTKWSILASAINYIRRLEDNAFTDGDSERNVMLELHRMAHRQFPWQSGGGVAPMIRAFKVFGESAMDEILVGEIGMTMKQSILLGAAIHGHFMRDWWMSINQNYEVLGISQDASRAFFDRLTAPISELQEKTNKLQKYDSNWVYAWNPMEATPLVAFDPKFPDRVICPITRYLRRRTTLGVYYDIVNSNDFDNRYGRSFANYVGNLIAATCTSPQFKVICEKEYYKGNKRCDGADWILSDSTGHIFIEAKTKRLTLMAKTRSEIGFLQKDLEVIARAIVQNYRNILDAKKGLTEWMPDDLPIYPLILTLEDLYLFTPPITDTIRQLVLSALNEKSMPSAVLDDMPYTIASVQEFESVSQVIAQIGISPLLSKKTAPNERDWSLLPFVQTAFPAEIKNVNHRLFADDWDSLNPNP